MFYIAYASINYQLLPEERHETDHDDQLQMFTSTCHFELADAAISAYKAITQNFFLQLDL